MSNKPKIKLGLILLPWIALVTGVVMSASGAAQEDLVVGDFGAGDLTGWQDKTFKNETLYELVKGDL